MTESIPPRGAFRTELTTPDDWLDEIADWQRVVREAEDHLADQRRDRDDTIRRAIAAGVTMYKIAEAAGLTQQTVRQIRDSA